MITGRQIRAARALLEWDAEDLAAKAGLSRDTIFNIEKSVVRPQEKTLANIIRVFDQNDVEFLESEGVRIRKNEFRVFIGKPGYKQFLDHVYDALKNTGGRIRQFNLSDGDYVPYGDDYTNDHLARMQKLQNIDARVLIAQGDKSFPADYCDYRWLDKSNKALIPYYVYGDYLAMPLYSSEHNVEIISIHSKLLCERYVEQFDLFWKDALIPASRQVS